MYIMYMAQLNMHLSSEFEHDLAAWMRVRGIKTKAEAIRVAVREGLQRSVPQQVPATQLIGAALDYPESLEPPRFTEHGDVWDT